MKLTVRISDQQFEQLQKLVEQGVYEHVSEAVRDAIRQLLKNFEEE